MGNPGWREIFFQVFRVLSPAKRARAEGEGKANIDQAHYLFHRAVHCPVPVRSERSRKAPI